MHNLVNLVHFYTLLDHRVQTCISAFLTYGVIHGRKHEIVTRMVFKKIKQFNQVVKCEWCVKKVSLGFTKHIFDLNIFSLFIL